MMDPEHSFVDPRQIVAELDDRHADHRFGEPEDAEIPQSVVVMEEHLFDLVEPWRVARRPRAVAIGDVVERHRTALGFLG